MGALAAQEDEEGRASPMAAESRSSWRSLQLLMTTANATPALVALAAATILFLTLAYCDARPSSSSTFFLLRRISAATSSFSRGSSDYSLPLCDASHGDAILGDGQWVYDDASRPFYTSETCPFLDPGFQCRASGRPDSGYLHWWWQPNRCRLPRFDPRAVLERLRGVRVAFVGDSIGRNQWESLLCMLATAGTRTGDVYEVNGQPITKHTGYLSFRFASYNCTIEYYRSPFLVPQTRPPPGSPQQVNSVLRVDTPDWSSPLWVGADVLVFNGGHWWNYEKTLRGGCYFSELGKVDLEMTVAGGYERALSTILNWVSEKAGTTQHVFFRTYSPVHFRNGTWRTGGQCHAETEPLQPKDVQQQREANEQWTNRVLRARLNTTRTSKVQLLDITRLTEHRKDGHPSLWYRGPGYPPAPKNRQDCSHWCLPGVPDTWNLLLLHKLGLLGLVKQPQGPSST